MWFLVTSTGQRLPISALPADIGSDATADVRLGHASVLPRHARLLPGSATGLRLVACAGALVEFEGWAVTEADLHAGDELLVGALRVRLEVEVAPGLEEPGSIQAPPAGELPTDRPADPARHRPVRQPTDRHPTRRPLDAAPVSRVPSTRPLAHRPRAFPPAPPARHGLLNADLGQLSLATRCVIGLGLLTFAAVIVWAVQALVLSLS